MQNTDNLLFLINTHEQTQWQESYSSRWFFLTGWFLIKWSFCFALVVRPICWEINK